MQAWKEAGFRVVGHLVFTRPYASKSAFVGYQHESAYLLAKGRPPLPAKPLPDVMPWEYTCIAALRQARRSDDGRVPVLYVNYGSGRTRRVSQLQNLVRCRPCLYVITIGLPGIL